MPQRKIDRGQRRSTRRGWRVRTLALAVLALASAAGAQQAGAPAAGALGLADALSAIAAHSQAAVAAGLDIETAHQATDRAHAPYDPSVALSLGHLDRDSAVVGVLGALRAPETEKNFFVGELDVTYLLWDGGRRSSRLASSRSAEAATTMRGRADVVSAEVEGLAAYLRALTLKAQRRVVEQRVASLQDHLREVRDLFEHGVVARNDLLATEVRLRSVEDQATAIDNGEAVAAESLNRLMGRDPAVHLELPAELPPPPPLPDAIEILEKRALDANPQVQALRARLAAERSVVAARRGENYPSVVAEASHTYQQDRFLVYPNANILFLGLSWQAYDGGARRAEVRAAQIAVERTQSELDDLAHRLAVAIDQAHRDYLQALKEAGTARTNVAAAEENLRIEEDQYRAGLARTTDVLDAEAVLAESRFAMANQHYEAYLRAGLVLSIAGEDLPAFFAAVREQ